MRKEYYVTFADMNGEKQYFCNFPLGVCSVPGFVDKENIEKARRFSESVDYILLDDSSHILNKVWIAECLRKWIDENFNIEEVKE